jgi:tetratricopeptide (TPR) repeat protein
MNEKMSAVDFSNEGKKLYQQGDYEEAADSFLSAYEAYHEAGDDMNAAEEKNNRSVCLLKAGMADEALLAVAGTPEVFESNGDRKRQAMALGNMGAALNKLGRRDEAIEVYNQSAEIFREIGEHDLRAPVLQALSDLQFAKGKPLESFMSLSAGLNEDQKPSLYKRFMKFCVELPLRFYFKSK